MKKKKREKKKKKKGPLHAPTLIPWKKGQLNFLYIPDTLSCNCMSPQAKRPRKGHKLIDDGPQREFY